MEDVFSRLKLSRIKLGFSQTQMATKSHFEQKDISRLENGRAKFIPVSYIIFLYKQGINLNWLYTGKGPELIEGLIMHDTQQGSQPKPPSFISVEARNTIDGQKEKLVTLQVENKLLKKQIKELKSERKVLLEAFKALKG